MNIFMIDDNEKICQSLKGFFSEKSVGFDYSNDLESGLRILKDKDFIKSVDLILLDGRGYLKKEDSEPNPAHVSHGLRKIRNLDTNVQIIIFSAFIDEVDTTTDGMFDEPLIKWNKSDYSDYNILLTAIEERVQNSELYTLKKDFSTLFSLFEDGFLDMENANLYQGFIEILQHMRNDKFEGLPENSKEGLISKCRKLQEHIYKRINRHNEEIVKRTDGYSKIAKQLSGNKDNNYQPTTRVYQSDAIQGLGKFVRGNTSNSLHYYEGSKLPSNYGFYAIANALFEIMLWYKNGIETGLFEKDPHDIN